MLKKKPGNASKEKKERVAKKITLEILRESLGHLKKFWQFESMLSEHISFLWQTRSIFHSLKKKTLLNLKD